MIVVATFINAWNERCWPLAWKIEIERRHEREARREEHRRAPAQGHAGHREPEEHFTPDAD